MSGAIVAALALTAAPKSALADPAAAAGDRDCSDFDNQRQAQDY